MKKAWKIGLAVCIAAMLTVGAVIGANVLTRPDNTNQTEQVAAGADTVVSVTPREPIGADTVEMQAVQPVQPLKQPEAPEPQAARLSGEDRTEPKKTLDEIVGEKQEELNVNEGLYDPQSMILYGVDETTANGLAERYHADVRTAEVGGLAVLYLPEDVSVEDVYADEAFAPYAEKSEPDYYVHITATNATGQELIPSRPGYETDDPGYGSQTNLDYLNLSDTWNTAKGAGVKIAVIDTGIDTDHPEFAGRISEWSYNASEDKTVHDYGLSVIEDEQGHGTQMAGVICAAMNNGTGITGIAPEAELIVIKCNADADGNFLRGSDLVFGLAYAIERDVDVVNMSFGTHFNIYEKYTALAKDSDVICVASAGNESTSTLTFPAADENVIGVGAIDDTWALASDSNYGDNSDVLAPGTVYTTTIGGGYGYCTGTSPACAEVTAAVALYRSLYPNTQLSEMQELLKASSIDLNVPGEDWQYGFGAIDIHALVVEEKGTITYEMLTDEVNNMTQIFVKGHTIQYVPEPERSNLVLDGWFKDVECTDECEYFEENYAEDLTLYANWINEDEGTAYIYTVLDDGSARITSYTGKRRYLTIPEKLEGRTVTEIGEFAFSGNRRIRSVALPKTLRKIDLYAFSNCEKLYGIEIPESVETIADYAFYDNARLMSVSFVRNGRLQSIGRSAFAYNGFSRIDLPQNLTSLGTQAFYGNTALMTVTVADGNTAFCVKNSVLYNKAGDTLIYFPAAQNTTYTVDAATTAIGPYAFAYSRCREVILPNGLLTIGDGAFNYASITALSVPKTVSEIGSSVCNGCFYLNTVSLPEGGAFTSIPGQAFIYCPNLKTIAIPSQITSIGAEAFSCGGLSDITFAEGIALDTLCVSAFAYTQLREIRIPDSVTVIEGCCFNGCYNLERVEFGQNSRLEMILHTAFAFCEKLETVDLPASVTVLGNLCFYESGLRSISIGANLTGIGEGAFGSCRNLTEIRLDETNPNYTLSDGVLFTKDMTVLHTYPAGREGAYTVPNSVVILNGYAFSGADKLTFITLNNGLKEICEYAFECCSTLETPAFPATLETIGGLAFSYCTGMQNDMTLPNSLISIGYYAFCGDYNLRHIVFAPDSVISRLGYGSFAYCGIVDFTVPESITTMGQEIFSGCPNLITVTFEGENSLQELAAWTFFGANELRQITFEEGNKLANIEARSLENLPKLQRVNLESCQNLRIIGNYSFQNCPNLTEVLLPEGLEEIGRYAFFNCTGMSRMDIPTSVNMIGRYAFAGVNSMNVYFKAATLPAYLEDNWDYGILGYYMGVADLITSGDWIYALTADGQASIVGYTGSATTLNLNTVDGHPVTSIGGGAFRNNTSIVNVTLPEGLQGIYQSAFEGTTSLGAIVIPDAVTTIDTNAFYKSGISGITFGENSALKTIGRYAFAETPNLKTISLPKRLETIRNSAFQKSGVETVDTANAVMLNEIGRYAFAETPLQSIAIPSSVKSIGYYAFINDASLSALSFGEVEDLMIYGNAFYGTGLTFAELPAGVIYIGETCFTNCLQLTGFAVDGNNTHFTVQDGVLFGKEGKRILCCPAGKTGSFTVPATVTSLAPAAFESSSLSEIGFETGSQLTTLGYRAFYGCSALDAITIPEGVLSIDFYAFAECANLETVTVPENTQLGGIYEGAFYNCVKLNSFPIPDAVQDIGEYAFYGCEAFQGVDLGENSALKIIGDYAFAYSGATTFRMPEGLLEVGKSAFQSAKLNTLTFNDVVLEIGEYAFADCCLDEVTVVTLPISLKHIGYGALRGMENTIEELTVPSCESTGNTHIVSLFGIALSYQDGFPRLTKITILSGDVTRQYCASLKGLRTIILPENTTMIEDEAFLGTGLEAVELPNSVL